MVEEVVFGQNLMRKSVRKQIGLTLYPPKQDQPITVRFVGIQQKLYQKWNASSKTFSFSEDKREGYIPRVISFVIDRADDKVKAFICPIVVFSQLGEHGPKHDFKISREGFGRNVKYEVRSLGETSVSDELLERIDITSKEYSLSNIVINRIKWELLKTEPESINNRFEILDL